MFIGQYVFIHSNPAVHIYKNNVAPCKYFTVAAITLCSTTKHSTPCTYQLYYKSLFKTLHLSALLKRHSSKPSTNPLYNTKFISVYIRVFRCFSACLSKAELGACDSVIHILDVFELHLKICCCII